MHISDNNTGEIIRELCIERGISRDELAEKVEISCSHLNKIEANRSAALC